MLNLLLVTLGLAALTELAGLSLALGAFLAGMLIAETEYRYQVEEDIKPFRDVLLGLFFVTVGMVLDLRVVRRALRLVLVLLVVPVLAKLALDRAAVARLRRAARRRRCAPASISRRRASSRSCMLALAVRAASWSPPALTQPVLAAMVLSMLTAPFVIHFAEPHRAQADRQRLARARGADHADRRDARWPGRIT